LLKKIEEVKKADREEQRLSFLELTKAVLPEILPHFQVKEVYITGSILIPNKFGSQSDIDIAVKGLPEKDYFTLLSRLNEYLPRNAELIELENCRFAEIVYKTGLRIK
jgi:predicted nucleotidyltransferase